MSDNLSELVAFAIGFFVAVTWLRAFFGPRNS